MSSTTWEGDIELLGDGTFEVEEGIKLILSGLVDVSSGSNFNSSGSIDITGGLTGSGNVNSTGGDLTVSGIDNAAYTGNFSVGSGATLTVPTGNNDYPALGNAALISLVGGSILNLEIPVQEAPQSFANYASFAILSITKKIPIKILGKPVKITVKKIV